MIRTFLLVAFAALTLSGCASITDTMSKAAGMGVVSEKTSAFDNATTVSVSPAVLWAKGSWGNRVKLGANWTSAAPDSVALVMAEDSNVTGGAPAYVGISSIELNIDGAKSMYSPGGSTHLDSSGYNNVSNTIYTSSTNAVVIPYPVLQSMVAAKDCRLRIRTSEGFEDAQFNLERIPGGQPTALLSIREFMARVDAIRAKR